MQCFEIIEKKNPIVQLEASKDYYKVKKDKY